MDRLWTDEDERARAIAVAIGAACIGICYASIGWSACQWGAALGFAIGVGAWRVVAQSPLLLCPACNSITAEHELACPRCGRALDTGAMEELRAAA